MAIMTLMENDFHGQPEVWTVHTWLWVKVLSSGCPDKVSMSIPKMNSVISTTPGHGKAHLFSEYLKIALAVIFINKIASSGIQAFRCHCSFF